MFRCALFMVLCLSAVLNTATAAQRALPDLDTTIKVYVNSSHSYKPITAVISKTGNRAKIIYSIFDKIDDAMNTDTAFANADKQLRIGKAEALIALSVKYRLYLYDTITVSDPALNNLTELLLTTDEKILSPEFKNRVVLDGTSVGLEITTATSTKKIAVNSPMPDKHPILYSFLKRLFSVYYQNSKINILREGNTGGY